MPITNVIGLILAGGQSKRMGQDKSMLSFNGDSFLDIAMKVVREAGISSIWVSGTHSEYPCIPDLYQNAGPACAIISAITHSSVSKGDLIVVIPLDMPLLSPRHIIRLLTPLIDEKIDAVIYDNHPFPCALRINALKKLSSKLDATQNQSMKQVLFNQLYCHKLNLPSKETTLFKNINTQDDYFALKQAHSTKTATKC